MFENNWRIVKTAVIDFIDDDALTRGAAISFYTVTTIGPLLLIVVSIAGLAFGRQAAEGAIVAQLSGMMGPQTAEFLQSILSNASSKTTGVLSMLVGVGTLVITASGVFGEMQSALNTIWKVETKATGVSGLLRARAISFGLVVVLGFLLMVSLVVSAALTALGTYLTQALPIGSFIISILNTGISFMLIAILFGAIFKVLPDRHLEWHDVVLGALITSFFFSVGKFLIALYLGGSSIATTYGAAGSLILLLLWVYYSVQIFLLGAEFTKSFSNIHGSHKSQPIDGKA